MSQLAGRYWDSHCILIKTTVKKYTVIHRKNLSNYWICSFIFPLEDLAYCLINVITIGLYTFVLQEQSYLKTIYLACVARKWCWDTTRIAFIALWHLVTWLSHCLTTISFSAGLGFKISNTIWRACKCNSYQRWTNVKEGYNSLRILLLTNHFSALQCHRVQLLQHSRHTQCELAKPVNFFLDCMIHYVYSNNPLWECLSIIPSNVFRKNGTLLRKVKNHFLN